MAETEGKEIQIDLPPSPVADDQEAVGPPWPSSADSSFLILPGKGNAKGEVAPGPDGPRNP
eukprot:8824166-Karenia_brevis.AAC.1